MGNYILRRKRYHPKDNNIYIFKIICATPKVHLPYRKLKRRMLDRFHAKLRKKEIRKARFDPNWPSNAKIRKALNFNVTVAEEQISRLCNRNVEALSMYFFSA